MAKIGRNEGCPWGSGKKHKRCCLAAPAPPKGAATITDGPSESHHENCDGCLDELNERADRVLDVLLDGRVDDAERLCHDFIPLFVEGGGSGSSHAKAGARRGARSRDA